MYQLALQLSTLKSIMPDERSYVFLTLHQNSVSGSSISGDDLIIFFRHLCITIHTLHRLGISHEDIKRSNVLVDRKGRPVVVDFGFSHFNPDNKLQKSAGGTLDYSSPEKVLVRFDCAIRSERC
jgi:serine/threonine protein kinase